MASGRAPLSTEAIGQAELRQGGREGPTRGRHRRTARVLIPRCPSWEGRGRPGSGGAASSPHFFKGHVQSPVWEEDAERSGLGASDVVSPEPRFPQLLTGVTAASPHRPVVRTRSDFLDPCSEDPTQAEPVESQQTLTTLGGRPHGPDGPIVQMRTRRRGKICQWKGDLPGWGQSVPGGAGGQAPFWRGLRNILPTCATPLSCP